MKSILFFLLLCQATGFAAELGEMSVTEVPEAEMGNYIVRNANEAILVVHTSIIPLSFDSNMGIISVDNPRQGEYMIHLHPGTNIIHFKNGEYQPSKLRLYIDKKNFKEVRVSTLTGPSGGRGSVKIETDPPGAKVTFNNILIPGITPLTLTDQPSGRHPVALEMDGYADLDEFITIVNNNTFTQTFSMTRFVAGLRVTSDPVGATVYLDGENLGTTPIDRDDLSPGEGTLIIELDGYISNFQTARLKAGKKANISTYLTIQTGSIEIETAPEGAELYIDDVFIGDVNELDKLALGNHTIRAELEGYHTAETNVNIKYDSKSKITLNLKGKPGSLFFTSTPNGASIIIDGLQTGMQTPYKINDIAAGMHDVQLRKDNYSVINRSVFVVPDKTTSFSETLRIQELEGSNIELDNVDRSDEQGNSSRYSGPISQMEFVDIPQGEFEMGSTLNEKGRYPGEHLHRVTISKFQIMHTEVTQNMWNEVMGRNPSSNKGEDLPVENVSWGDCLKFIKKLNDRDSVYNYRLPTEAEWEYACRSETKSKFYIGNQDSDLERAGWYEGNSDGMSHAVGQKVPNYWGLFDMHGNVSEWCQNWKGDYSPKKSVDPEGPVGGTKRINRGGNWNSWGKKCRSACRSSYNPKYRNKFIGLRLVRKLD